MEEQVLTLGTYKVPPELKAIVVGGDKVIVSPRVRNMHPKGTRNCGNCLHRKCGKYAMSPNQWWESHFCEKKPKVAGGKPDYFYCAPKSRPACELYEPNE